MTGNRKTSNAILERFLDDMVARGIRVFEHPKHGGVNASLHIATSWHPRGGAGDLNFGAPGAPKEERAALIWAAKCANALGLNAIYSYWRQHPIVKTRDGHWDHLHVDVGYTYGFPEGKLDWDEYNALLETPVPGFTRKPKRLSTLRPSTKFSASTRLWQNFLIEVGLLEKGQNDGKNGPITQAATKAYQKRVGLKQTGIVTHKEWYHAAGGVSMGDEGYKVKIAQAILGFGPKARDGIAGRDYAVRSKELQRWLAVKADSDLGRVTISNLVEKG